MPDIDTMLRWPDALMVWVVYRNPRDCPGQYVLRPQAARKGRVIPSTESFSGATLEDVRRHLPPGLHWMPRDPSDEPQIVEIWI